MVLVGIDRNNDLTHELLEGLRLGSTCTLCEAQRNVAGVWSEYIEQLYALMMREIWQSGYRRKIFKDFTVKVVD